MKLVEESVGRGVLTVRGERVGAVGYAINRYQAMTPGGLPVPGLHRIEGRLALHELPERVEITEDLRVVLELDDGRALGLTLVDATGRVLAEGHGPGQCGCC